MLKAIELLKVVYEDCLEWENKGFATTYSTHELNLAIAELEALENRSCSNCKYYHDEVCCNDNSLLCADFVNENFCCNKWEPK